MKSKAMTIQSVILILVTNTKLKWLTLAQVLHQLFKESILVTLIDKNMHI